MADSTIADVSKMKVIDLRKELRSRGLPSNGDKSELILRLQAAMSQDDHGDINLDSDEIDSDGVLEDEDDKKNSDNILDDPGVDALNEELALADEPPVEKPPSEPKLPKTLKRKITSDTNKDNKSADNKEPKKIVLNRSISLNTTKSESEEKSDQPLETTDSDKKIKLAAELDAKTRLEMRAQRFGLPVKITDAERKEARKQRFGQNVSTKSGTINLSGSLTENIDKLKQRAERFGQSVSKIMTDIENKEKLEKRKAKFGVK